jgi:hypothetical protein
MSTVEADPNTAVPWLMAGSATSPFPPLPSHTNGTAPAGGPGNAEVVDAASSAGITGEAHGDGDSDDLDVSAGGPDVCEEVHDVAPAIDGGGNCAAGESAGSAGGEVNAAGHRS